VLTPLPPKEKFWSCLCIQQSLAPVHKCLQLFPDFKHLTLSTAGTIFKALENHSASFKPFNKHTCGRVSSDSYASAAAFQSCKQNLMFAHATSWQHRTQFTAATEEAIKQGFFFLILSSHKMN
jgi:hypothetical protein